MREFDMIVDRPIRMAMIGGGPGSFIGPIHRMAAELDARIRLVAGTFSRDPGKGGSTARQWGIDLSRSYPDADTLLRKERARPDGADFITIATPNHLHFPVACAALRAGFHVMSDKPAALDLKQASTLAQTVAESGKLYGLTYSYAGYPAIRAARAMVRRGDLGPIRKVMVDYSQGWLSRPIEREGDKQAAWRADPAQAGVGGCIGDIGVHAFHLAEFVSGLEVERLCADVATVVPGRVLDDDCHVLLKFSGRARGMLTASQVSTGARNNLILRIYGESGGVTWSHERQAELTIDRPNGPTQTWHVGMAGLGPDATSATRLPTGHPEGFIEAFANLYTDFARAISEGRREASEVPGIADGVRGMAFVETALKSQETASWIELECAI